MTIVRQWSVWVGRLAMLALLLVGGAQCSDCSLSVATKGLPNGTVGVRYFSELNSHCGGDSWFIQTGELPPGIGLQDNGDLAGTPNVAGLYTFTVAVFDFGTGETAFRGLSLFINEAPADPTATSTEVAATPTDTPAP